jgi:hypothetical protein
MTQILPLQRITQRYSKQSLPINQASGASCHSPRGGPEQRRGIRTIERERVPVRSVSRNATKIKFASPQHLKVYALDQWFAGLELDETQVARKREALTKFCGLPHHNLSCRVSRGKASCDTAQLSANIEVRLNAVRAHSVWNLVDIRPGCGSRHCLYGGAISNCRGWRR